MNTCKDCKWWECVKVHGKTRIMMVWGDCTNMKLQTAFDALTWPSDGLNASDYIQAPVTGPEFGCVHWEQK